MLKFHNIFTLISQQIIGSKLLIMDKRNDISRDFKTSNNLSSRICYENIVKVAFL